jgi:uncharacterized protein YeaC (DUF1315 family)
VNIDDMISGMTPEIYQRLVTAVELGKWPDGVALTPEQKRTVSAGDAVAGAQQHRRAAHDDRHQARW